MPPRTPDSVLAPFNQRLGQEPDHVIAKEAGVSRALIIGYRKRLGIPPYEGYKFGQTGNPVTSRRSHSPTPTAEARNGGAFRGRKSALDPYLDLLGKVPDGEIANMADVTPENVRTYRGRRGIPAMWQQRNREEATAARPTDSSQVRTAYLVNVDRAGTVAGYAIVATDFADAARVAVEVVGRHQAGASIKAIQRIAEFLE